MPKSFQPSPAKALKSKEAASGVTNPQENAQTFGRRVAQKHIQSPANPANRQDDDRENDQISNCGAVVLILRGHFFLETPSSLDRDIYCANP